MSTVGLDEETIRKYIREQEEAEKQQLDYDFPAHGATPICSGTAD